MSNDNTAKPTVGQWKSKEWEQAVKVEAVERTPSLPIVSEVALCTGRDRIANARIVTEAGLVYHETGLTPRQLVAQRDELLRILKTHHDEAVEKYGDSWGDYPLLIEGAATIAKCETKP